MDCLLHHSSFKVYKVNPFIALLCPYFRTVTCESSKGQLYCRPHFLEVVHGICKYYVLLLYDYVHSVSLCWLMDYPSISFLVAVTDWLGCWLLESLGSYGVIVLRQPNGEWLPSLYQTVRWDYLCRYRDSWARFIWNFTFLIGENFSGSPSSTSIIQPKLLNAQRQTYRCRALFTDITGNRTKISVCDNHQVTGNQ